MADLEEQLRAYGQQLEQDAVTHGTAEGWMPPAPKTGSQARHPRGPWFLVAAATAAVVVAASLLIPAALQDGGLMNRKGSGIALGFCLVAAACTSNTEGGDATTGEVAQSAVSTAAPSSTAAGPPPLPAGGASVEPGTYSVDRFGTPIQVTVPAGWTSDEFFLGGPDDSFLGFLDVTEVRTDSCDYIDKSVTIGPSVDDMVTALVTQKNTDTTEPRPIEVDGYTGTEVVITSPPDLDVKTTCYGGARTVWDDEIGGPISGTVGTPVTVWVLDLDGQRVVITVGSYEPMSDQTRAELDAMAASIQIG